MAIPIDPSRSTLPPVAQFLAEAALQRQTSLLGLDKPGPAPLPPADPSGPPPTSTSPTPPAGPLPAPADKASISAQAREQLGAGFDPRREVAGHAAAAVAPGAKAGTTPRGPLAPPPLPVGASAPAPTTTAASAASVSGADWPTTGLGAPLMRMVGALVAQLTAGSAAPQRVTAAQPWPIGLAQALESGAVDADAPALQTWLVRQGSVQTPEGPRGFALTLRVPVPWLASQAPSGAAAMPPTVASPLQVPFTGNAQSLQSGVFALVLQGLEASAPRTSALLVMDFQPQLPATVYGRDMLQARLDPWTQMAVLQASGQVPREDERARNGASGLCDTVGCPYAARAACVQPFCLEMRGVLPPEPVGPVPPA
ncbi:hypothetical protein [Acidovorax sp.]|uniref:hypothetical protein n=1 Tax=Acidovorax sp. TaxID=1872122 RepID=UPI002625A36C|nr:hypothetical protein [Acidovorax sp.]